MGIQGNGENLYRTIGALAVISFSIVLLCLRRRRATTAPSAPSQTTSPNAPSQTAAPSVPSQTTSPYAPSQTAAPSAPSQTTAPSASANTAAPDQGTTVESLKLNFSTVKAATNDFAAANEIGKGGFGLVYKGQLPNGQEVAVKRHSLRSSQGKEEFDNEIVLAAKFQHRNLVKLIGFAEEGEEKLLIFKFMPNASLDRFIYDPDKHGVLDWETRLKIIKGIAEGLLHLHESSRDSAIHRDLKPSNILLDENLNPKIADFGLAKLLDGDQTHENTRCPAGTIGYKAPEYALHGNYSKKSDVYAYGVVVLEIVTGINKHSFDAAQPEHFLTSAWRHWIEGTTSQFIVPKLRVGNEYVEEVVKCFHIALACVQDEPADRPFMEEVVTELNNNFVGLKSPKMPLSFLSAKCDPYLEELFRQVQL